MSTNIAAETGAVQNGQANNALGALNSAIGWSHLWHGMTLPPGMDLNDIADCGTIGSALGTDPVYAVDGSASKRLKVLQCAGAVAPGAVVSAGWINATGANLVQNEYVMAREA